MKKQIIKKKYSLSGIIFLISVLTSINALAQPVWSCGTKSDTSMNNSASSISQPTDCIKFLNDFIPKTTDSVIEIRVKMTVFTPTTGVGTWDNNTTARALNALAIVNNLYSNLAVNQSTLWPANPAHISNARIKFVLVGNLNIIADHATYTYVASAESHTAYNDPTVINVYYGASYPVNGPGQPLSWWAQSYVDQPLPNNHIYFAHGIPGSNVQYDLGDADWAFALAHELGHALGLDHTELNTSQVYNGYSIISSQFGCCQKIAANDYPLDETNDWYPCLAPNYSNNLMTLSNGCMQYLSPQQMAIIHYNIRTVFKRLLTTKGFNDATTVNHSSDYSVVANETWTSDRYLKGDLIVKANKTLIIKCMVAMTKNAKIKVEVGGQLIIDGGKVTNISGRVWDGIYIVGNPSKAQLTPNPSNSGAVLYQGIVRLKNNATISQALIGIRNYYIPGSTSGGVIFAQNSNFINNIKDIDMIGANLVNVAPIPSSSWFYNCNFKTTGIIGDANFSSYAPDKHISLARVEGVKIMGCVFQYTANPLSGHGDGIYSVDATYIVDKNGTDSCVFENLWRGIYVNNVNPLKVPLISNSKFIENQAFGAYFMNAHYLLFQFNIIQPSSIGVYLNNCKYYKVKNNLFKHPLSSVASGLFIYKSMAGAHEVYHNTFSNLSVAINCMDNNGNTVSSTDGLKLNCNKFNQSSNSYDVVLSHTTGLGIPTVNRKQGETQSSLANAGNLVRNLYGATCNANQNKWQIYSGSTVQYNHGSNTNTLVTGITQPTATGCKSNYLNVVDMAISLDYITDCPIFPQSSGGTSTISSNRLASMNDYILGLQDQRATDVGNHITPDDFELQSTVASKLNLFLTDSLNEGLDSVVTVLESNQGYMEDVNLQTIFAYMNKHDYSHAQNLVTALSISNADLAGLLTKVITLEQDTVNGIDNISTDDSNFFRQYALEHEDGQALALAVLKAANVADYTEPYAYPEGLYTQERRIGPQSQQATVGNIEDNPQIQIFPNPAQTGININYSASSEGTVKIEIKDLLGKIIYTNFINARLTDQYIPLSGLSSGMYLITFTKNKEIVYTSKIIKQD